MKKNIKELAPNVRNPRRITDEKLAMMKKSLDKFGELNCIVFNVRSLQLVSGHQRQKAMQEGAIVIERRFDTPTHAGTVAEGYVEYGGERYKYREVDVDDATEKAMNLAANKHGGEFDIPLLNDWLLELDGLNVDMDLIGFTKEELENLMAPVTKIDPIGDPESVPAEPKKIKVRSGEVFQLGESRVYCGNSTILTEIDKLMDGAKADMVFVDPPYNVAYEGKTKDALKIQNDEMDDEKFYQFLYDAYTSLLMHTKAGGAIYVAHADTEGANFRNAMKEAGWLLKQCLIWVKQTLVMGRQDYHWKHEPILYGWAPGAAHNWYTDRKQTTVLEFDRPSRNQDHPTMKPVELVAYMIRNSSKPGDLILDTFGGSGTTLIAAVKEGRKAYLCELDPKYCHVIIQRWVEFVGLEAYRIEDDGSKTPWTDIIPTKI